MSKGEQLPSPIFPVSSLQAFWKEGKSAKEGGRGCAGAAAGAERLEAVVCAFAVGLGVAAAACSPFAAERVSSLISRD